MKILEVRDGFIKFEADRSISLSSFVKVNGIEKSYIAQVIQLKRSGENSIAYAKILFLYNNGEIINYDKTLPPIESEITEFTDEILKNSIYINEPVISGKTLKDIPIIIDASAFDNKMLISVDDSSANNILVRNFTKQFTNLSKPVVIIDTLGVIKAKKVKAGVDFKLPLNTESLAFMYQDCLNDATSESKATIIEIFKELAEYSKTVPFLPFEALKTIVDDMVDKAHVFKLLVLKNKLAKFERLGYFAKNKQEVDNLKHLLNSSCIIIDLSELDPAFLNRYLEFIYDMLNDIPNTQVFLELSNVVSKKNIKNILSNENISTTFITHSRFKYLNDIKNVFDNFIIAPSFANNEVFNIYSTFIKAMKPNTCLIAGEATNYIPLVSSIETINDLPELSKKEEEVLPESDTTDIPIEQELEVPRIEENIVKETTPIENEEILASIEESSDDAIAQAEEDLTPPDESINMFTTIEEDNLAAIEESEEEPEVLQEMLNEENELPEEINEPQVLEEEIPVTESFETEVHMNEAEEITDYTPPQEELEYEEITLNQEFNEDDLTPSAEEDNSIQLDDDIDLDLESEPEPAIDDIIPEQEQEEPENEMDILPISGDDNIDFDEIVELDPNEADENDIIIDMEEEPSDDINEEDLDAQIVKDVDKVFTTRKDDDISDSDLDFIDELNNDEEVLLEEISDNDAILEEISDSDENKNGILEPAEEVIELKEEEPDPEILETRSASTPIVPVYDADIPQEDMVMSDPIQQGDTVTHAKYGTGVVEKMIKYGNKTLFSINFDNIGRRLLDPALTEIKKS